MGGYTEEADFNDTQVPLELVVDVLGRGGLPGLTPTVAIRLFPSTNLYLDWVDLKFKAAGWGLKFNPMVDIGNGIYQQIFNAAGVTTANALPIPYKVTAEYNTTGVCTSGEALDLIFVTELRPDAKLARQFNTNRLESFGGNPGQLVLFADDGVTVQSTQQLRDFLGGAVIDSPGCPAKRSAV